VNVTLRPATRADQHWLDTWLRAVAVSNDYIDPGTSLSTRMIIERTATEQRGTVALGSESVGILIVRANAPKRGNAIIELVATPPEHARHGAGMAAAALLERDLQHRGIHRMYAPAPASHGIAMYFWIRLGYRPLLRNDWPCVRDGVAWLARDLSSDKRQE